MKTRIIAALSVSALLFTSCVKNDDIYTPNDSPVAAKFKSGINVQQTKAVGALWESGDEIGIFMVASGEDFTQAAVAVGADNRLYSTSTAGTSVGFTADVANTIFLPNDASDVQFKAYYPYKAGVTAINYPITTVDQSSQQSIDLMVSAKSAPANKLSNNVELQFVHKLSKVEFQLKPGEGITLEDLDNAVVTINDIVSEGHYSFELESNEVVLDATSGNIVTKYTSATKLSEAIIVPQDVTGGVVEFLINGEKYTWEYDLDFVSGNKYRFNVTINKLGLDINGTITDWTTGEILEIIAD